MPLTAGARLGPYEVVSVAGAGGMGEVYRARDTRLDRTVAIKILPPQVAGDRQFRERFDREARVISKLAHGNICALYDLGDAEGAAPGESTKFLVMEYLEGETLATRLAQGRLPVSEALGVALEIARALDHAHRHGIVHRDLKPGNVMLTKSGAKLLDFGLATAEPLGSTSEMAAAMPTMAAPLTAQGTILGTFQYMAPEQVEGRGADMRSDIFAFGAVLYEMLTGQPAFRGNSPASLLGAILKDDPVPVTDLQPGVPQPLEYLVRTCLAKDPDARVQSAHDVLLQLQGMAAGSGARTAAPAVPESRRYRGPAIALAMAVIGAAVGGTTMWWLKPAAAAARPVVRWQHLLPLNHVFINTARHVLALSPDGSSLAYLANRQLYLRPLDKLEAQPLLGSVDNLSPTEPVFSPDGKSIAYFVGNASGGVELRKIAIAGGTPVRLGSVDGWPWGASWRGNQILFGQNSPAGVFGIRSIPDTGGEPRTLVSVNGATERAAQPVLLDDGRHLLFSVPSPSVAGRELATAEGPIVVQAIGSSERKVLVENGLQPRVVGARYLVYMHEGTLFAAPFNAQRLEVTGEAIPLLQGLAHSGNSAAGQFAIADNGLIAYIPRTSLTTARQLVIVDRLGSERVMAAPDSTYQQVRLSPDGRRLALSSSGHIWTWTFATDTLSQVTSDTAAHWNPAWMGNTHIVYDTTDSAGTRIMRRAADGSGAEEVVLGAPAGYPNMVTPDGKQLVYHPAARVAMIAPVAPGGEPRRLLPDVQAQVSDVELSPDGRWIAYESNESGRFEVYVRPFPNVTGSRSQISSDGGQHPLWSRDGRELFFIAADGMMMAVPVQFGPTFTAGRPTGLFQAGKYFVNVARDYDVTPDGKAFILVRPSNSGERQSIVVVTDWFEEIRAKMRAAR
jgi:eukaryotic-like serine/threonine-protein kinase